MVEPGVLRPRQRAAHHAARVALVGLAAGLEHVAEQPADLVALAGPPRQDRNVAGSGMAIMSDSSMRLKPVIEEPSKPMPSSKAPASSSRPTAKDFSWPRMSVNQKRMNSTFSVVNPLEDVLGAGR